MSERGLPRLIQSEALELARCRYADEPCGFCVACQVTPLLIELDPPWGPGLACP